jgi:hypothetical protein
MNSPLFEITRVLVRSYHIASIIVHPDHGMVDLFAAIIEKRKEGSTNKFAAINASRFIAGAAAELNRPALKSTVQTAREAGRDIG